jgi:hypothetical protein
MHKSARSDTFYNGYRNADFRTCSVKFCYITWDNDLLSTRYYYTESYFIHIPYMLGLNALMIIEALKSAKPLANNFTILCSYSLL